MERHPTALGFEGQERSPQEFGGGAEADAVWDRGRIAWRLMRIDKIVWNSNRDDDDDDDDDDLDEDSGGPDFR